MQIELEKNKDGRYIYQSKDRIVEIDESMFSDDVAEVKSLGITFTKKIDSKMLKSHDKMLDDAETGILLSEQKVSENE